MSYKYSLGIDIGGSKMEAAIIELSDNKNLPNPISLDESNIQSFKILIRKRIPTNRDYGYKDVLARLQNLIQDIILESKVNASDILEVGIGLPGSVHPETLKMIHGNSQIFENRPIKEDLLFFFKESLKISPNISLNNDANCFALAESLGGAGVNFKDQFGIKFKDQISIGIILGTGCGGGILINGHLLNGKIGGGGEIGHTVLHNNGRDCYCGRKGCAEVYLSGSGLEFGFNLKNSSMSEDIINAKEIFHLIEQTKDKLALSILGDYQEDLLKFICNLSNIFDPHYFVLGGGLSNQDAIYQGLEEKLSDINFLKDFSPKIYKNKLGDSAGVLGAALLPHIEKN
ncbi:MAG: ROK family protein [Bacteriovoracaceae bacterium]|jgi:fructokinase|nr:ROK family protein [Bacteriovoracaceae bacterium]